MGDNMSEEQIIEITAADLAALIEEDAVATEYSIETNIDDNKMRFQFHNEEGLLSTYTMDAPEAYLMAQRILRGYDKLEGI